MFPAQLELKILIAVDTNLVTPLRNVLSDLHPVRFIHGGGINELNIRYKQKRETWGWRFRRISATVFQSFLSNKIKARSRQRTVVREMVRPEYAPIAVTGIWSLYHRKSDDSWRKIDAPATLPAPLVIIILSDARPPV